MTYVHSFDDGRNAKAVFAIGAKFPVVQLKDKRGNIIEPPLPGTDKIYWEWMDYVFHHYYTQGRFPGPPIKL